MNTVILVGHVGTTATVRHTRHHTPVVTFPLATTTAWSDEFGKPRERREWHRIVAWGDLARSSAPSLQKGVLVCIEGTFRTREAAEGAQTPVLPEIIARRMVFPDTSYHGEEPPAGDDTLS